MVKNLRAIRLSKGISQQQLANVIGTTQQSINKYENHSTEPDIETLIQIADYFEVSVDSLIGHPVSEVMEQKPGFDLSREEVRLLQEYRALSKEEKESIRLILRNYLKE
ncbi:MAG: helix-turn-helix transcriptional regulator [Oscillospiraceae bacterium]|jgi:transcriptional regulator with XRE-family HTH domain|nr:helix-turn-helix transcriptional regulator [Oscillospiraceae bacterium]